MHSDKHIEHIETVFKNLSSMLDVSFEIRDSGGHLIGSPADKQDSPETVGHYFGARHRWEHNDC